MIGQRPVQSYNRNMYINVMYSFYQHALTQRYFDQSKKWTFHAFVMIIIIIIMAQGHFYVSRKLSELCIDFSSFQQISIFPNDVPIFFFFCIKMTYRSVVLTLPVRSENSLISLDRKSSSNRSPCFAAAKISSYILQNK